MLQRSRRELWAMLALFISLSLVCTHLGIMVLIVSSIHKIFKFKLNILNELLFFFFFFSSSLIQRRVSYRFIRPSSLCSHCCGVTPLYETYARCTQFSALCFDYYWLLEVFGSWLSSVELFSSVPTGTQHIVSIPRTEKEFMINLKNEMSKVGSQLTCY